MAIPQPGDYAPYAKTYVDLVVTDTVIDGIDKYTREIASFFQSIPAEMATYRYAHGKWSLKEMLQHIIDAERIFSYRALTFARRDAAALPGFEENDYAANSHADDREWNDLLNEFLAVRTSTDLLYKSFTDADLQQKGLANNNPVTVNAVYFITYGHILHHIHVIKERYLSTSYGHPA